MWVRAKTLLGLKSPEFDEEKKRLERMECTKWEGEVLEGREAGWVRRVSRSGELLVWLDRRRFEDDNDVAATPSSPKQMYFPLVVAILAFLHHAFLAVFANYIPDETLAGIATAYGLFGTAMSIVGLLGAVSKRSPSIVAFAVFLLLDAFISAVCRLLLLQIFVDALFLDDQNTCGDRGWYAFGGWRGMEYETRHSVVTSARWQRDHARQLARASTSRSGCSLALGALQALAIGIVLSMAMIQGKLSVDVRRYGKRLAVQGSEAERNLENSSMSEKASIWCA